MVKDTGLLVTRDQLKAYAQTLSPGMVVTAPMPASADSAKAVLKKEGQNTSCVILSVHPHFVRVQGLDSKTVACIPYIDLFTRNKIPAEILQRPKFDAPKVENIVEEDWSELPIVEDVEVSVF